MSFKEIATGLESVQLFVSEDGGSKAIFGEQARDGNGKDFGRKPQTDGLLVVEEGIDFGFAFHNPAEFLEQHQHVSILMKSSQERALDSGATKRIIDDTSVDAASPTEELVASPA